MSNSGAPSAVARLAAMRTPTTSGGPAWTASVLHVFCRGWEREFADESS